MRGETAGWHGIELRHLAALRAIAHERSFSGAAVALGYTQSAISGQIIALERVVGTRLVERLRGSPIVGLTPEGEVLAAHATAIATRLDTARAEIALVRTGAAPALRIGTFQTVARAVVATTLRRLAQIDGEIDVTLHEAYDTAPLLERLERGNLDLAFTLLPVREGPFETVELYRDTHALVVRSVDPLARRSSVRLDELDGGTLIRLARGPRPADDATYVDDVGSLLSLVSAGLGIGLVPARAVDLPRDLAAVRVDGRAPSHVVAISWHVDRARSSAAQRFVELAATASAALTPQPPLYAVG